MQSRSLGLKLWQDGELTSPLRNMGSGTSRYSTFFWIWRWIMNNIMQFDTPNWPKINISVTQLCSVHRMQYGELSLHGRGKRAGFYLRGVGPNKKWRLNLQKLPINPRFRQWLYTQDCWRSKSLIVKLTRINRLKPPSIANRPIILLFVQQLSQQDRISECLWRRFFDKLIKCWRSLERKKLSFFVVVHLIMFSSRSLTH